MSTVRDRPEAENPSKGARRGVSKRIVAGAVLGVLLVVFAVLNSQTVRVHWIVTTTSAPMIVVIVVSGVIGAAIAWLVSWRRRRRDSSG